MKNTKVRQSVVELLDSESRNANWEEEAESPDFDLYYGSLTDLVENFASSDPRAWKVLATANYNDDSPFARGLAQKAAAQPTLLALASNDGMPPGTRGRILFVLAMSCSMIRESCSHIRQLLRLNAVDHDPSLSLAAVRGLGVCGETGDLSLLDKVAKDSTDHWFVDFVRESEQQIQSREPPKK